MISVALRSSLPPPDAHSLVPTRWLACGHARLSGWHTPALLGAIIMQTSSDYLSSQPVICARMRAYSIMHGQETSAGIP